MKIKVLWHDIIRRMASKLLPGYGLMPALQVRSASWHHGASSSPRVGVPGLGRVLIMAAVAALLGGCGPSRSPQEMAMPTALLPPPAPTPGPDYRVQLGDTLKVAFLFQPENDIDLVVRPDGRISLAAAGEIEAVGKTEAELEEIITARASEHMREPKVTVTVTKIGTQNIYVGGEVLRPGVVTLVPGMTPLQAVMEQGGFRPTAKRDSVVLILPTADGKFSASRINLEQVLTEGVAERVRLRPNAVVFVPKTWVANANDVVDLYVRGLIPALPRVGVGYSLNNTGQ
jgi:protein involved in polysaccharide export with SLBB domain